MLYIPSYYHNLELYEKYYNTPQTQIIELQQKPKGVLLPHHTLVGSDVSIVYKSLKEYDYERIILLGPNHFDSGYGDVITTDVDSITPYGRLAIDTYGASILHKTGIITTELEPFLKEHSISFHTAFIKKTFPNTPFIPLMIDTDMQYDTLETLIDTITTELPNSLIIASIDFSHYLPMPLANLHDDTSKAILETFSSDDIDTMEIDCTPCMYLFMRYLDSVGAYKTLYTHHTNSASYTNNPSLQETTSHFYYIFGEGDKPINTAITALFYGDAMLSRGIKTLIDRGDNIWDSIENDEKRGLYGTDIKALNLECVIDNGTVNAVNTPTKEIFLCHKDTVDILKNGMFDSVNIANNHTMDNGKETYNDMITTLENASITVFGKADNPCTTRIIRHQKVALCGIWYDISQDVNGYLDAINTAKKTHNYVFSYIHWNLENTYFIPPQYKEYAQKVIDSGADVVIGSGPHMVWGVLLYGNNPLFMSVGDVIFDTDSTGIAAGITIRND